MKNLVYLFVLFFLLVSCNWQSNPEELAEGISDTALTTNKYAIGFSLTETRSYAYAVVFNPWQNNDTLATYAILKSETVQAIPRADFIISQKIDRIALLSSTCIGMFKQLNETSRISAVSDADRIYDSVLYERFLSGKLKNLGESNHPNAEAIIAHAPDMIMKYIYVSAEPVDQKIMAAGIPIVYNLEYMEPHPLGRAEWLKFVAVFLGREELADSIFNAIESEYLHYSSLARNESHQPTVMDGSSYKGVWYAAGGNSYPATLYTDAGADYYWKRESSRGSLPLSIETILDKQQDADFWIGPSNGTKAEILAIEERYSLFKSFQNNNVFQFGKRVNPNGGHDYYESGVLRPDVLLKDLIWVFHPNLLDENYSPVYLKRLD